MSKRQAKIIVALEDFGYLTFKELAEEVGAAHLDTALLGLEKRGLVMRNDENPPKFYSTTASWLPEMRSSAHLAGVTREEWVARHL